MGTRRRRGDDAELMQQYQLVLDYEEHERCRKQDEVRFSCSLTALSYGTLFARPSSCLQLHAGIRVAAAGGARD